MNCAKHPDIPATAFCRSCGKPLCEACQVKAQSTVFCEEHQPIMETAAAQPVPRPYDPIYGRPEYTSPYTAPPSMMIAQVPPLPPNSVSPGLAFLLGWIPGVGAIYNGQYAKGLIHVIVFGLIVSVLSSGESSSMEPLLGMLLGCMAFYMPFEAYHTAKRRMQGIPVDEFSSFVPVNSRRSSVPAAPLLLIFLGVLFLLANFHMISIRELLKFWPVGMIVFGAYLLMVRVKNQRRMP